MLSVLIVDHKASVCQKLADLLSTQPDFTVVGQARSVREVVDCLSAVKPDVVLLDFDLLEGGSLDAVQAVLLLRPHTSIIILAEVDDDESVLAALRSGARGYLLKNLPTPQLLAALRGISSGQAALSRSHVSGLIEEYTRLNRIISQEGKALSQLTAREMDVLCELVRGRSNQEIARRLFISEYTVKNHVHNILEKLSLSNRREIIQFARKHDIHARRWSEEE